MSEPGTGAPGTTLCGAGAPGHPTWVEDALDSVAAVARVTSTELVECPVTGPDGVLRYAIDLTFPYVDLRGTQRSGSGRLYLHPELGATCRSLGVVVEAGYTQPDEVALPCLREGFLYATVGIPTEEWPGPHPISRGLNLDLAFLHLIRSLPIVDPLRVVVSGMSIGGRNALLMAAESFPLLGVVAHVPPLDWRWNASYLLAATELARAAETTTLPGQEALGLTPVGDVVEIAKEAFGPVADGDAWRALSPLAHVGEITCRVATVFSTADMLVPIQQVAADLAPTHDEATFPAGFIADPAVLLPDRPAARTLVELVPEVHVAELPLPDGATLIDYAAPESNGDWRTVALPSSTKRWSVSVIPEGPVEPRLHHFKHQLSVDHAAVLAGWAADPDPSQLDPAKLAVLMRRIAGVEWLTSDLRQLDDPAAERGDVLRGLAAWLTLPGALEQLRSAYAELPDELRLLDEQACADLSIHPEQLGPRAADHSSGTGTK